MRIATYGLFAVAAIAVCFAAVSADAVHKNTGTMHNAAAAQTLCNGVFSNGNAINVTRPVSQVDVGYVPASGYGKKPPFPAISAAQQTSCDVNTFAWNQFLYLTSINGSVNYPRFMLMAPWYNVLLPNGSPPPKAYPGGPVNLETAMLDQGQAGNDNHLLDVNGNTVRYDIRFDPVMYSGIAGGQVYTRDLFTQQCQPDAKTGTCANEDTSKVWLPPTGANEQPEAGSIEVKTAWRDFGAPGKCPSDFYCQGRFGLVGLHYVNKTFSHGEWVWATFEHVSNDPDCAPGGDQPIAAAPPVGPAWSFFNPKTVPSGVMTSKMCNVQSSPPQCNTDPKSGTSWVPVNVCRTISAAAGGASATNCAVTAGADNVAGNVSCLNATIMPKRSGPWRNYKLVGALWVEGGMGFMTDFRVVGFQTPLPNYQNATPTGIPFLANTTMETWFQHSSSGYRQTGATIGQGGADAGCFLCHNLPSAFGSHNKQMDLSHFPGKLPPDKLMALKNSLIAADSTAPAPK